MKNVVETLSAAKRILFAVLISTTFMLASCENDFPEPEPQDTFQDDPPKEDGNNKPPCLTGC